MQEAFQRKPDIFFEGPLSRCKYLCILLVYTCIVMQFIFISALYNIFLYFVIEYFLLLVFIDSMVSS